MKNTGRNKRISRVRKYKTNKNNRYIYIYLIVLFILLVMVLCFISMRDVIFNYDLWKTINKNLINGDSSTYNLVREKDLEKYIEKTRNIAEKDIKLLEQEAPKYEDKDRRYLENIINNH